MADMSSCVNHRIEEDRTYEYSYEIWSIVVDGLVELGGGLVEAEAVLEGDSADDIG